MMMENVVYIGTYTKSERFVEGQANGILRMNIKKDGSLEHKITVAEVVNPSFLTVSFDKKNLYAVSELYEGETENGFIYSYKINDDNSLVEREKLSTKGLAPCHLIIDKTDSFVFVSNYKGGTVAMFHRKENGELEEKQQIQLEDINDVHLHSVCISNNNDRVYLADLGNDKIWIYELDASKAELKQHKQKFVELERGSGPRHLRFSLDGRFLWSVNELGNSISILKVNEDGALEFLESISSLPETYQGKSAAAEIQLHPTGDFLYVSNRGHNSIASYRVDKETGKLKNLDHTPTVGETPRNFAITAGGDLLYIANQDSNNITIFGINTSSGELESRGEPIQAETPVCIAFNGEEATPEQIS